MKPDLVVLPEPVIEDDLCLLGRREPLGIQNLPTWRSVEPLCVSSGLAVEKITKSVVVHREGTKERVKRL